MWESLWESCWICVMLHGPLFDTPTGMGCHGVLPQPHHMQLHHLGTVNYSAEASVLQNTDELSNNLPAVPYTVVMSESKYKHLPWKLTKKKVFRKCQLPFFIAVMHFHHPPPATTISQNQESPCICTPVSFLPAVSLLRVYSL